MKTFKILSSFFLLLCLTSCATTSKLPQVQNNQVIQLNKTLDLRGQDWLLPEGAKLVCTKKSGVKNGRVLGRNASVVNVAVESVHFSGSFRELDIQLMNDVDSLCYDVSAIGSLNVQGNGHVVSSTSFGTLRNTDVCFKEVVFDCERITSSPFLYVIGNGQNTFSVEDCKFINISEVELLKPRNMLNPVVRGCEFCGLLREGGRTKETIVLNRFYECKGNIVFENNSIHDCHGVAVNGIGYSKNDVVTVSIRNNEIRNVSNGGIVFNGGEVTNVVVENNKISNVFCFGPQFEGERGNAENAAINFHGFHDVVIRNNTITDCIHSSAMDLDGTTSDGRQEKGVGLIFSGNILCNVLHTCMFGVKDVEYSGNEISVAEQDSATSTISAIILNACHNVNVHGNDFSIIKPRNAAAYPILIRQNSNRTSGRIQIQDNIISSDTNVYLMIYDGFTGEVDADNNKTISTTSSAALKWVNNSKSKGIRVEDKNVYR